MSTAFEQKVNRCTIALADHRAAILFTDKLQKLGESVTYSFWEPYDEEHTVIRLATGWSTTEEDLEVLRGVL